MLHDNGSSSIPWLFWTSSYKKKHITITEVREILHQLHLFYSRQDLGVTYQQKKDSFRISYMSSFLCVILMLLWLAIFKKIKERTVLYLKPTTIYWRLEEMLIHWGFFAPLSFLYEFFWEIFIVTVLTSVYSWRPYSPLDRGKKSTEFSTAVQLYYSQWFGTNLFLLIWFGTMENIFCVQKHLNSGQPTISYLVSHKSSGGATLKNFFVLHFKWPRTFCWFSQKLSNFDSVLFDYK